MYDVQWRDIPVYICNRNRLDGGFRRLVEWLLKIGMTKVIVIDNQSTFPPLLAYYKEMGDKLDVRVQDANIGPRGFWERGYHTAIDTPYIYTDCDLVPADTCPDGVIEMMLDALGKTEPATVDGGRKVGVGLRIDNLPDHFCKKDLVIKWESQFWRGERVSYAPAFFASVDTTFAMYHPKQGFTYTGMRLDNPFVFEHVPWYSDESKPTEEDTFYKEHYETAHEGGKMWKSDVGGWSLYGWSVRSKASLEGTFKVRGYDVLERI